MGNARSRQTDRGLGALVLQVALGQERTPFHISLVVAVQEFAEFLHEFQKVEQGRALGRRNLLFAGFDVPTCVHEASDEAVNRNAHPFGLHRPVELGSALVFHRPIGPLLRPVAEPQIVQELLVRGVLKHARRQALYGKTHQLHTAPP